MQVVSLSLEEISYIVRMKVSQNLEFMIVIWYQKLLTNAGWAGIVEK